MTTLLPLSSAELADLKAKAKAATPGPWIRFDGGGLGHPGWLMYPAEVRAKYPDLGNGYGALCWASEDGVGDVEFRRKEIDENFIAAANPETILRLIDMVERRDAVVLAAQKVVDDALLAGAIESNFSRLPALPIPPSSTTAKLIRLRETLAATETT